MVLTLTRQLTVPPFPQKLFGQECSIVKTESIWWYFSSSIGLSFSYWFPEALYIFWILIIWLLHMLQTFSPSLLGAYFKSSQHCKLFIILSPQFYRKGTGDIEDICILPQITTDSRARIWSPPASRLSLAVTFDSVYSNSPTWLNARVLVTDNEYKLFNSITKFSSISNNVIWCENVQADPKSINQTKPLEAGAKSGWCCYTRAHCSAWQVEALGTHEVKGPVSSRKSSTCLVLLPMGGFLFFRIPLRLITCTLGLVCFYLYSFSPRS